MNYIGVILIVVTTIVISGLILLISILIPNRIIKIVPKEAKKIINANPNTVLIDVRTIQEYRISHLPESILIPYENIRFQIELYVKDKNVPLILYCQNGYRSHLAAKILKSLKYKNLYYLATTITDWS